MDADERIRAWRGLITDPYAAWVLFRHGTCVILDEPVPEPAARATDLLREFGPVQVGTNYADFDVVGLGDRGRLVTCHHPAILVLFGPDEVPPDAGDMAVGLVGRAKRGLDAQEMVLRHVEWIPRPRPNCACLTAPGRQLSVVRELGMDENYAEASVLACRVCGRRWLRYYYEMEAFSRSGRWYLGHIPTARALGLVAGEAKRALERLDWYYFGGSTFDGKIGRGSGDIFL